MTPQRRESIKLYLLLLLRTPCLECFAAYSRTNALFGSPSHMMASSVLLSASHACAHTRTCLSASRRITILLTTRIMPRDDVLSVRGGILQSNYPVIVNLKQCKWRKTYIMVCTPTSDSRTSHTWIVGSREPRAHSGVVALLFTRQCVGAGAWRGSVEVVARVVGGIVVLLLIMKVSPRSSELEGARKKRTLWFFLKRGMIYV